MAGKVGGESRPRPQRKKHGPGVQRAVSGEPPRCGVCRDTHR